MCVLDSLHSPALKARVLPVCGRVHCPHPCDTARVEWAATRSGWPPHTRRKAATQPSAEDGGADDEVEEGAEATQDGIARDLVRDVHVLQIVGRKTYDSVAPTLGSTWSYQYRIYLSEIYDQTTKNKLEKNLISGAYR